MREIKFRAWDKRLKKITEPFEFFNPKITINGKLHTCFKEDIILMQYTGLHDKNGKEIYEGDIIRYRHYECYPDNEDILDIVVVKWKNAGFYPFSYLNKQANIEVIGNIYENPELVEGEKS